MKGQGHSVIEDELRSAQFSQMACKLCSPALRREGNIDADWSGIMAYAGHRCLGLIYQGVRFNFLRCFSWLSVATLEYLQVMHKNKPWVRIEPDAHIINVDGFFLKFLGC